jgi:DNA recombination protein RmuC
MNQDLYLILAILIAGFFILYQLISRKINQGKDNNQDSVLLEWLKATQTDLKTLQSTLNSTLQRSDKNVTDTLQKSYQELNTRLDSAAKVIGELKTETGKFSEIGRSMKDLQDFLKSPKLRGNIGEQVLEELVGQILPKQTYKLQHHFKSGSIVDLAITTQAGIIPIDSKFPLENFTKMSKAESNKEKQDFKKLYISDVKKHIKDISTKYIRTEENTTDFAVMYIPSESLYYEITANAPELSEYAQKSRVIPVSPSTLYAFLRTILMSFEGQRIAKEAQSILRNLRDIQKTSVEFSEKLGVLNKHISNAYNNMNIVSSDFHHLQSKIDTTRDLGSGISQEDNKIPAKNE